MALFSIPTNQSDSGNMGVSGLRLRNLDRTMYQFPVAAETKFHKLNL